MWILKFSSSQWRVEKSLDQYETAQSPLLYVTQLKPFRALVLWFMFILILSFLCSSGEYSMHYFSLTNDSLEAIIRLYCFISERHKVITSFLIFNYFVLLFDDTPESKKSFLLRICNWRTERVVYRFLAYISVPMSWRENLVQYKIAPVSISY